MLLLAVYFALPPGRTGNRPCVIHICECGRCSTNPRAFELTHNLWTFMVWRSFAAVYHLRGVLAKAPIIRNGSLWKKFFNLQYAKSFLPDSQGTRLRPVGSMTIDESYAMSIAPQIDQKLVDTVEQNWFCSANSASTFLQICCPWSRAVESTDHSGHPQVLDRKKIAEKRKQKRTSWEVKSVWVRKVSTQPKDRQWIEILCKLD